MANQNETIQVSLKPGNQLCINAEGITAQILAVGFSVVAIALSKGGENHVKP